MKNFYVHSFDKNGNALIGKRFTAENVRKALEVARDYNIKSHRKNSNLKRFELMSEGVRIQTYSFMY